MGEREKLNDSGYINIYRKIRKHWIWDDAEKLRAWLDILMMVNYEDRQIPFDGHIVTIKRGQKLTSLSKLAKKWGWTRNRVDRFLVLLAEADMVTSDRTPSGTVLTVVNYDNFQHQWDNDEAADGTAKEPKVLENGLKIGTANGTHSGTASTVEKYDNSRRAWDSCEATDEATYEATNGTPVKHKEEINNNKKYKKENIDILSGNQKEICDEVVDYLNKASGKSFKPTSDKTQRLIKARLNDGFTLDDFKAVIDTKTEEWRYDDKMAQYIRPETLFGTKFESYLNARGGSHPQQRRDYDTIIDFGY